MDDRISVIIPIYNVSEQNLKQCIDGVISQTYTALDILLIDDGSTNGSGKICDSYEVVRRHDSSSAIHQMGWREDTVAG